MSIRRRLLLSNIAMVFIPVLLFMFAVMLLVSIFFEDVHGPWDIMDDTKNPNAAIIKQEFAAMIKTASLSPELLEKQDYLLELNQRFRKQQASIIVRKGSELIFKSPSLEKLSNKDLLAFAQADSRWPVQWLRNQPYKMNTYHFYYSDGIDGTIFLVQEAGSIANFGWGFFPIMFGILLFILIATNGLLTFIVSKSIIKPVNELIHASHKISEGDLNFHIETKKKDELGKLSKAFDHMRQKLKESITLQLQYEENRKELIANISHDLKTPITSIKGYVEGIRDGVANTPEKMERYLNTIYTKAVVMDKLIDELILYSKLDMKRMTYEFVEVDLRSFLLDFIEELRFDFEYEGVSLFFDAKKTESIKALVDKEKIKRVMINIVHNCLKYMDKDEKHIQISLEEKKEYAVVRIADNGPGIPEAALPFVFDRFYRADPSRNTRTGGSGLGLAIVKSIIEDHGGSICAESELGKGTTIVFTVKKSLT